MDAWPVLVPPAPPAPPAAAPSPPAAGAGGPKGDWQPPVGWPRLPAITYVKELVTTLLLVLALPYVAVKLVTDPGALIRAVGRKHTQGA